jgi:hypothetical protein
MRALNKTKKEETPSDEFNNAHKRTHAGMHTDRGQGLRVLLLNGLGLVQTCLQVIAGRPGWRGAELCGQGGHVL